MDADDLKTLMPELPCVILHGRSPCAMLSQASVLTECAFGRVDNTRPEGSFRPPRDPDEEHVAVQLPAACPWGGGTRVTVRRINSDTCDATLVHVPLADEAGTSAAHLARCSGVLEVCKDVCNHWCISMRRKVVVVHLVCRLPASVLLALARVIERSIDRALFVLTSTRPSAIPVRLRSLAQSARVRWVRPAPTSSIPVTDWSLKAIAKAVAAGTLTPIQAVERLASSDVMEAASAADHLASRLRALGVSGDTPDCRAAMAAYFV